MPADKYCVKCGKHHLAPVGDRCKGPILGDLEDKTRRSQGALLKPGGSSNPSQSRTMAAKGESEDIPVVRDEEEETLIKELQQLECDERKANLREQVRLKKERAANPLQHPPAGAPGGVPGGQHGTPGGQQFTPEELEKERSKWAYTDFFKPKERNYPTYREFIGAAIRWGSVQGGASAEDLRRYLCHLSYIANKAIAENAYMDEAHIGILYKQSIYKS